MYDYTLSKEIQAFAIYLDRTRTPATPLPTQNYDLVLDVMMENDEIIWAYYYVDHDTKTLFWKDVYECRDNLLSEIRGVQEASHVSASFSVCRLTPFGSMIWSLPGLRLESLYWWDIDSSIYFQLTTVEGYIGHFIPLAPTGSVVHFRWTHRKSYSEFYWVVVLVCSLTLLFAVVCWFLLVDSLTSKASTSPYSVAQIESMRAFMKDAESKSDYF